MPHKGTPIRYGEKHPVRSRQQGAEVGQAGKPRSGARKKFRSAAYVLYVSKKTKFQCRVTFRLAVTKFITQRSITSHLAAVFWRLSGMASSSISWDGMWVLEVSR